MAIGLYNQITETSSLMIGEQIHLIGFDNIELTRYMRRAWQRSITPNASGALATEQLIKLIAGKPLRMNASTSPWSKANRSDTR